MKIFNATEFNKKPAEIFILSSRARRQPVESLSKVFSVMTKKYKKPLNPQILPTSTPVIVYEQKRVNDLNAAGKTES